MRGGGFPGRGQAARTHARRGEAQAATRGKAPPAPAAAPDRGARLRQQSGARSADGARDRAHYSEAAQHHEGDAPGRAEIEKVQAPLDHRADQLVAAKLPPLGGALRAQGEELRSDGAFGLCPNHAQKGLGMTSNHLLLITACNLNYLAFPAFLVKQS